MSNLKGPTFLILKGDGINCENETSQAFELVGAATRKMHINDLLKNPHALNECDGLAIPGGFSFGDELGSGQILALKMKYALKDALEKFVQQKKPLLGICNGFQVLVKLGLLPFVHGERGISLGTNRDGKFMDCWSTLKINKQSVCKWTTLCDGDDKGKSRFRLPVRHGEGRVVLRQGDEKALFNRLNKNGQIPLTYEQNFNGSYGSIAGICDESGLIFGMMPHPEANTLKLHSGETGDKGFEYSHGVQIFQSIMEYLSSK